MNNKLIGLAALLSAGLASICCIGPLVLGGLGLGSLGLAAGLTKYRPLFLGATALALGAGFYYAYRKRPVACADGTCAVRCGSRTLKAGLWVLTALAAALATFPSWSALSARSPAQSPSNAVILPLKISGMTCAACAVSIEKSVEKVPGVYSARVDFNDERATVNVKDGTDVAAVLKAVEAAGYKAHIVTGGESGK